MKKRTDGLEVNLISVCLLGFAGKISSVFELLEPLQPSKIQKAKTYFSVEVKKVNSN